MIISTYFFLEEMKNCSTNNPNSIQVTSIITLNNIIIISL